MALKKVTIQLDENLIRDAKVLAAERGLSLSALVARDIREKLATRTRLERARQVALESMAEAAASRRTAPRWHRADLIDER